MTGPIRDTTGERAFDVFVESPTRANKTAVEVFIGNADDIVTGAANEVFKLASVPIAALKCISIVSPTHIKLAESDVDFQTASVFGIALTSGNTGEAIKILTGGVLNDSSFNWPVTTQLYVDATGSLTDVAPLTGFRTLVATSNGPNEIFIKIQEPIIL